MPPSSRLLYYDLGMAADDDGVVEAYTVMTQTRATEDDLRVLVSRGYVTILNEDLVTAIADWKTNNTIRGDRYHPSLYKDLLLQLNGNQMTTTCQPNDNQMETEVKLSKVKLSKDKLIEKENKEKKSAPPTLDEVKAYVKEKNLTVDPVQFYDYFTEGNWIDAKGQKVRSWKQKILTWEKYGKGKKEEKEDDFGNWGTTL